METALLKFHTSLHPHNLKYSTFFFFCSCSISRTRKLCDREFLTATDSAGGIFNKTWKGLMENADYWQKNLEKAIYVGNYFSIRFRRHLVRSFILQNNKDLAKEKKVKKEILRKLCKCRFARFKFDNSLHSPKNLDFEEKSWLYFFFSVTHSVTPI